MATALVWLGVHRGILVEVELEELIQKADAFAQRQDVLEQGRLRTLRNGPPPGREDWYSPAAEGALTPIPHPQDQGELDLAAG